MLPTWQWGLSELVVRTQCPIEVQSASITATASKRWMSRFHKRCILRRKQRKAKTPSFAIIQTQIKEQRKTKEKSSYHWPVSANSYRAILLSVLFRIKKQLLSESAFTCPALSYSVTSGASRPLSRYILYWNIMSNCWLLEGIFIRNLGIEPCFSNVLFFNWWLCPIILSSVSEKYSQILNRKIVTWIVGKFFPDS